MRLEKMRKLYYAVPSWVKPGTVYHIRIRCSENNEQTLMTPQIADSVLRTAAYYHRNHNW